MNQPMTDSGSSQKKMWMWVVIAIVIIAVLAVVWWLLRSVPEGEDATTALETQGTSDEVAAISADLQATDFENLDAELDDIDAELAQ